MNYGMACRAHRNEVINRVDLIPLTDVRERFFVMHVNQTNGHGSVHGAKVELAGCATRFMMFQTASAGGHVSLIPVYFRSVDGSLPIHARGLVRLAAHLNWTSPIRRRLVERQCHLNRGKF